MGFLVHLHIPRVSLTISFILSPMKSIINCVPTSKMGKLNINLPKCTFCYGACRFTEGNHSSSFVGFLVVVKFDIFLY